MSSIPKIVLALLEECGCCQSVCGKRKNTHTQTHRDTHFSKLMSPPPSGLHTPPPVPFSPSHQQPKHPPLLPSNPSSFLLQVTAANCLGRGKRWFKLGCKAVWAGSGLLNNHHELTHLSSFIFIDFLALESRPLDKESLPACSYACKISGFLWFQESRV